MVTEASKGHSTVIPSQLLQDRGEQGKHEHRPSAGLHLLHSELFDQKQCCVKCSLPKCLGISWLSQVDDRIKLSNTVS